MTIEWLTFTDNLFNLSRSSVSFSWNMEGPAVNLNKGSENEGTRAPVQQDYLPRQLDYLETASGMFGPELSQTKYITLVM